MRPIGSGAKPATLFCLQWVQEEIGRKKVREVVRDKSSRVWIFYLQWRESQTKEEDEDRVKEFKRAIKDQIKNSSTPVK